MTHESGTGGAAVYGNFRVTPAVFGSPSAATSADEHATPGYYSVVLRPQGIRAELTAVRLAALERFTYPPAARVTLTLDAASTIQNLAIGEVAEHAWIRMTGRRSFEGGGTFGGGFGGGSYRMFFAAQLDRTGEMRLAGGGTVLVASFDTRRHRRVMLRIGISYTSPAMAARHLTELPAFDFGATLRRAQKQWGAALAEIDVQGGSALQRQIFATALYHSHLMPHDVTGDGGWPLDRPHYEDFFTLWDTFRTLDPLLELTEPQRMSAMINSLITTYQLTGWLPDARIATRNGITQVGSSGDVLVADALVHHLGGVDYKAAYRALIKDATVNSPDPWAEGRMLADWLRLHYVALDENRSASRTLEYAYDDFAISEVAQRLGHPKQAARYRAHAKYWTNLWDPATQSIRPRNSDGSFLDLFSPTSDTYGPDPFFEGVPLEWSTFVPQDVQGLINRVGGDQRFVNWLQDVMTCCSDPGNEPDLLAPWLFIHAGRPDLTDAAIRRLLENAYSAGRDGLPGNDDAGALSSWYVWSAIGLYPNAGQPYYYIGSPVFTRVRIMLAPHRTFTISAPTSSKADQYVVGATLNHRALDRAYLTSDEIERGGTLVLRMAARPSRWGAAQRPFSLTRSPTPTRTLPPTSPTSRSSPVRHS